METIFLCTTLDLRSTCYALTVDLQFLGFPYKVMFLSFYLSQIQICCDRCEVKSSYSCKKVATRVKIVYLWKYNFFTRQKNIFGLTTIDAFDFSRHEQAIVSNHKV